MPLDRFVLIIVCVIAAAAATIWLAVLVAAWAVVPPAAALALLVPSGLVAYVVIRVIHDRLASREDDHYDRIDK